MLSITELADFQKAVADHPLVRRSGMPAGRRRRQCLRCSAATIPVPFRLHPASRQQPLPHTSRCAVQAVVHFWAAWCEPCKFLDEVLRQLAADQPAVAVVRVEAEEAADISEQYSVSVVPYFLFFRGGQMVDSLEGADAAALTAKFGALAAGAAGAAAAPGPAAAAAAPAAAAAASSGPPSTSGGCLQLAFLACCPGDACMPAPVSLCLC